MLVVSAFSTKSPLRPTAPEIDCSGRSITTLLACVPKENVPVTLPDNI